MRFGLVLGFLMVCTQAFAGSAPLDTPSETLSPREQRAQLLQTIVSQYNGLVEPLDFGLPSLKCDRSVPPVTRALLVSSGRWGPEERFWLQGPPNDTEFLRNTLIERGANGRNLARLTGENAGYRNVIKAAKRLLNQVNCGDSVILHFTGLAYDASLVAASTGPNGPFSEDRKTASLGSLANSVTEQEEPQDRIIANGPFLVLNQTKRGKGELLPAATVSELVTKFRNRSVDVAVIFDVSSSELFRLEERQARADQEQLWRKTFQATKGQNAVRMNNPTLLNAGAGELSVFYGTARGQPGAEMRLPRGQKNRKPYGLFSFNFSSALLQAERTTAVSLLRSIKRTDVEFKQSYIFSSTSPDTELVVENRRDVPRRKGAITIIDPKPTRGGEPLKAPSIMLRGKVDAAAETMVVTVNGRTAQSTPQGNFETEIELEAGVNRIDVLAMTRDNQPITHSFELFFEGDMSALLGTGARYALMIANEAYAPGSGLSPLSTPIGDAEAIATELVQKYGFQTTAETLDGESIDLFLRNASRLEIETALYRISQIAGERDTVLIFYAGHGIYEPATEGAFWLPVDAKAGLPFSYLPAAAITDAILRINAGNVLVISDSCYSGALLRGGSEADKLEGDRLRALQRLADKRSRIVVASGGNEPVLDGGGDGHSVFAKALLSGLRDMPDDAFTIRELFDQYLLPMVVGRAAQEPQYRPIERSGHEGGDVVLARLPN